LALKYRFCLWYCLVNCFLWCICASYPEHYSHKVVYHVTPEPIHCHCRIMVILYIYICRWWNLWIHVITINSSAQNNQVYWPELPKWFAEDTTRKQQELNHLQNNLWQNLTVRNKLSFRESSNLNLICWSYHVGICSQTTSFKFHTNLKLCSPKPYNIHTCSSGFLILKDHLCFKKI
jgi:hypothetical protein